MHITKFRIQNYKCFREPSQIALQPGFNVITGRNSIGKTALLEALTLSVGGNHPHRSVQTAPTPNHSLNPNSEIEVSIRISSEDFWTIMPNDGNNYYIPLTYQDAQLLTKLNVRNWGDAQAVEKFLVWFKGLRDYEFSFRIINGAFQPNFSASFGMYPVELTGSWPYLRYSSQRPLQFEDHGPHSRPSIGHQVSDQLRARIYRFLAERLKVGRSAYGENTLLNPDASNLPEVLVVLQSNHARFREFVNLTREILPQVKDISIVPKGGANEIFVWNIDSDTERLDLAIPLQESGTGIGQVLAILYIVLTSSYSRPILIDEPQSFLHPGAARKLIEVLKRYKRHQFIVATHSPTIISAADPNEIIWLHSDNDVETNFKIINARQASWAENVLGELGVRLSDVFGADGVIWVEGPTEERCFPRILSRLTSLQLMGTNLLAVRRTADLEGKDTEKIIEIYEKLTRSNALIPPAIGFIFDRESRTDQEIKELKNKSRGMLELLPRRMYENYLLDPRAITAVIHLLPAERQWCARTSTSVLRALARRYGCLTG